MASGDTLQTLESQLVSLLADLAEATMPFGRYGPQQYPPAGVPLVDLPYEYLAWFSRSGFPKGRLGEMLMFVYRAKQDGADALFDSVRAARGGRVSLRRDKRRHWAFAGEGAPEDP